VEDVFAGLAELPTLVPHLNTLVLNVDEEVIFASFWEALHRALLVRRTGFLLVRITMLEVLSNWRMPPPDIIAAFRAWAMDGIQIQLITRHNPKEWARRGHLGPWEKWNHTFA
jgi:hypothetical protein